MTYPTLDEEKALWDSGYSYIAGVDEVGRGSFAGPLVVGAVIFPKNHQIIKGVADSKLVKPKDREKLAELILEQALSWNIVEVDVDIINQSGIGQATQIAFERVIKEIKLEPDFVLIDAFKIKNFTGNQRAVLKGDRDCYSISAASVIAKVYRDKLMEKLHLDYPQYGFSNHKGYGTKAHRQALKKHGLSKIHRTSFNLTKYL